MAWTDASQLSDVEKNALSDQRTIVEIWDPVLTLLEGLYVQGHGVDKYSDNKPYYGSHRHRRYTTRILHVLLKLALALVMLSSETFLNHTMHTMFHDKLVFFYTEGTYSCAYDVSWQTLGHRVS